MGEKPGKQQLPEFSEHGRASSRSAYFATLFTGLFAVTLMLVLWMYSPSYTVLLQNVDSSTLALVSAELQKSNIAYRYDSDTASVLVPERALYQAKFVLGTKDLARGTITRLLVDNDSGLQSSQNSPSAETIHKDYPTQYFALETELAKTISSIENIQWARVHLAISDSSSNQQSQSRASIFVRLAKGRVLGEHQLASIAQLIAASAPNLSENNVAIIDQSGNLLKSTNDNSSNSLATLRLSYTRMLEQSYTEKIESLLVPIFGERAVRVRVDADIDYSQSDKLSGSKMEDKNSRTIKRLLAMVVVDNKVVNTDYGQAVRLSRSKYELHRIEKLVKDAIGYNEGRGDQVNIYNESFGGASIPLQKNHFLFTEENNIYYVRILLIALAGLAIAFFVLRKIIQMIMEMKPVNFTPDLASGEHVAVNSDFTIGDNSSTKIPKNGTTSANSTYEALLSKMRQQVNENPAHVAKILKTWVRDNGR